MTYFQIKHHAAENKQQKHVFACILSIRQTIFLSSPSQNSTQFSEELGIKQL